MKRFLPALFIFILSSFPINVQSAGKCKVPGGKWYKTTTGPANELIAVNVVDIPQKSLAKYIKIIDDKSEIDHDLNWVWLRFTFETVTAKPIATVFVSVDVYDAKGNKIYNGEARVYNNRICKTNYPIHKKHHPANALGYLMNVPPEAAKIEWRVNKIGFAVEL